MPNAERYVLILLAVGGERISICGKITLSDDLIFHFLVRESACLITLSEWLSPFPLTLLHFIASHLDFLFFNISHVYSLFVAAMSKCQKRGDIKVEVYIELMVGGDTVHTAGKTRYQGTTRWQRRLDS